MRTFPHPLSGHGPSVVLLAVALLLSACARTPPVDYYHLAAVDPGGPKLETQTLGEAVVGIGPVRVPDYLDRPQIVNRQGVNLLQLTEGNRWAEPLTESIPRTLRENLAAALATERFVYFPWNQTVDYQIPVEIVHFEGEGYRVAHLAVIWSIEDVQGTPILPPRRSEYQVTVETADNQGLVQALSRALALFSREIAEHLSRKVSRQ